MPAALLLRLRLGLWLRLRLRLGSTTSVATITLWSRLWLRSWLRLRLDPNRRRRRLRPWLSLRPRLRGCLRLRLPHHRSIFRLHLRRTIPRLTHHRRRLHRRLRPRTRLIRDHPWLRLRSHLPFALPLRYLLRLRHWLRRRIVGYRRHASHRTILPRRTRRRILHRRHLALRLCLRHIVPLRVVEDALALRARVSLIHHLITLSAHQLVSLLDHLLLPQILDLALRTPITAAGGLRKFRDPSLSLLLRRDALRRLRWQALTPAEAGAI